MTLPTVQELAGTVERVAGALLRDDSARDVATAVQEATCRAYRSLRADPSLVAPRAGECGATLAAELGRLHEALLERRPEWDGATLRLRDGGSARRATGSWFTPPTLVEHLLDQALEPVLAEAQRAGGAEGLLQVAILDPACGAGAFLAAAAHRLAHRIARCRSAEPTAAQLRDAHVEVLASCVYGVDRDPGAVELARIALWHQSGASTTEPPEVRLVVADALLDDWPARFPEVFVDRGGFDVVVGNPPFLNQLQSLTAHRPGTAAALAERSGGALRAYTDVSAVFLHRSLGWLRPGGRSALVQPQSLLGARDAGGVRAALAAEAALESLWATDERVFSASVQTCAPVLRRGAVQGPVRRSHGPQFRTLASYADPDLTGEWSFLLAAGLGVPEVALPARAGVLGDIAACTADFRDQYYGLEPYVREARDCPSGVPLVTTGLIDPAVCWWGRRDARFLKRRWKAPVVDVEALRADEALNRWATNRLVPKVLLATQGRVLEAVADPVGAWLPSVPTVSVVPEKDRLWHALAVLLAPPVAAHAAARYAGTALTMRAIKLSASQAARLPLPVDRAAWDRGAELAERLDPTTEQPDLSELAAVMCAAYGVRDPAVLRWWRDRWSSL